jgi:hypothetical protein
VKGRNVAIAEIVRRNLGPLLRTERNVKRASPACEQLRCARPKIISALAASVDVAFTQSDLNAVTGSILVARNAGKILAANVVKHKSRITVRKTEASVG